MIDSKQGGGGREKATPTGCRGRDRPGHPAGSPGPASSPRLPVSRCLLMRRTLRTGPSGGFTAIHGPVHGKAAAQQSVRWLAASSVIVLVGLAIVTTGCSSRTAATAPAIPAQLMLADQIGGSYNRMVRAGDDVVMGWGPRVAVFPASPSAPLAQRPLLSQITPGVVRGLAVDDDTIYASIYNFGVVALDLSDTWSGQFTRLISLADPRELTVQGNFGAVIDGLSGEIVTFSAKERANPRELYRYSLDSAWAAGRVALPELLTSGAKYIYAAYVDQHLEGYVASLEFRGDGQLSLQGSMSLMQPVSDLAAQGDLVYVVERYTSIHALRSDDSGGMIELADFGHSTDQAHYPAYIDATASGIAVAFNPYSAQADTPVVAFYTGTNPWTAEPLRLNLSQGLTIGELLLNDSLIMVLRGGLVAIAISPDQDLAMVAEKPLIGYVVRTAATDNYVFLRDAAARVWCIEQSKVSEGDWTALKLMDALPATGDIATTNDVLITAHGRQGLQIWSVSERCMASRISSLSTAPYELQSVRSYGSQVIGITTQYIRGAERQALIMIDATDPTLPVQKVEIEVDLERPGWLSYSALDFANSVLAIAGRSRGIYFYDLTDPNGKGWPFEPNDGVSGLAWDRGGRLYFVGSTSIQSADVETLERPLSQRKRTANPLQGGLGRRGPFVLLAETDWESKSRVVRLLDAETLDELEVTNIPDGRVPSVSIEQSRSQDKVFIAAQDTGLLLLGSGIEPLRQTLFLPFAVIRTRH